MAANLPVEQFESRLAGQRFRGFHRLGKYLVFELDNLDLVSHLRMEGKFQIYPSPKDVDDLDERRLSTFTRSSFCRTGGCCAIGIPASLAVCTCMTGRKTGRICRF
ncbi:DNA-formamidopyrimidine glycosylase family protein [Allobaculum sp. Allo2]|uniref:DNA-formamidopyrimidine glycosylase family protein n=1 Tax=Allobaculum sp. Allo2 TaxID=2853432 RepID=UPI0034626E5C